MEKGIEERTRGDFRGCRAYNSDAPELERVGP
jgi:hypothetical protein